MNKLEKNLILSELRQILKKAQEHNNYVHTMEEVKERLEVLIDVISEV